MILRSKQLQHCLHLSRCTPSSPRSLFTTSIHRPAAALWKTVSVLGSTSTLPPKRGLATMVEVPQSVHHIPNHPPPPAALLPSSTAPGQQQSSTTGTSPAIPPSFYKRPLPASCISFDSPEGKALFRKAMAEGYMENYFPLAQSFLTQNEPAYCGLATLCMILNALGVDPQKQFKGPWRYYSQEMLDCCRSLTDVADGGITLAEFACLARCNGLDEHTRYGTTVTLEEFERDIERICSSSDGSVMAISYSRKTLGQTGDGHFSPIAGYCKESKRVLVLDVARFKYPSYWVHIDTLFASLEPIDRTTNQPRGYSILRATVTSPTKSTSQSSTTTAGLLSLNFNKDTWPDFVKRSAKFTVDSDVQGFVDELIADLSHNNIKPLQQRLTHQSDDPPASPPSDQIDSPPQHHLDPINTQIMEETYEKQVRQLVAVLRTTGLWTMVNKSLKNLDIKPSYSIYPPALEYTLFILALVQCRSTPLSVKTAGRHLQDNHSIASMHFDIQLQKQVSFILEQMTSLDKCCSKEKSCTCSRQGPIDLNLAQR